MLTFNLKKEWFEKIKSGEKTHEYREYKEYWVRRLYDMKETKKYIVCKQRYKECIFCCGYPSKGEKEKILKAKIKRILLIDGINTDLKIDKPVFDIKFELISEVEE